MSRYNIKCPRCGRFMKEENYDPYNKYCRCCRPTKQSNPLMYESLYCAPKSKWYNDTEREKEAWKIYDIMISRFE